MASLTIRNLPEDAKMRFRQIAAAHGRSMEEHLRQLIISATVDDTPIFKGVREMTHNFRHFEPAAFTPQYNSRTRIDRLIALGRGIDFELPPRETEVLDDVFDPKDYH